MEADATPKAIIALAMPEVKSLEFQLELAYQLNMAMCLEWLEDCPEPKRRISAAKKMCEEMYNNRQLLNRCRQLRGMPMKPIPEWLLVATNGKWLKDSPSWLLALDADLTKQMDRHIAKI